MRREEETMKSSSVSNMKEDGCHNFKYLWEMCDHNFEDKTSLEKHECKLAVKRSTRRTTSRPCFVPSTLT